MPLIAFGEVGSSGLRAYAGQIYDSVLAKLQGPDRNNRLRAMADTDDVVGGSLRVYETLGRSVRWWVAPGDESPEQQERAEFVWDCFNDMSHSFQDLLSNAYSVLDYGFAPLEIVYKVRRGPEQVDSRFRSKYSDGLIGWRKLALRGQTSVSRWFFDDSGGIAGIEQQLEGDMAISGTGQQSTIRRIPIDKLILLRTTTRRGNPEGRALTEAAYRSWFKKTHLEDVEAIAAENNMVGVPTIQAPETITTFADSAGEIAEALRIITTIRQGTATGVVIPHGWGGPSGEIKLVSSPGPAVVDMDKLIKRLDSRIAISMLTGFLLTGLEKVGSYALSSNQLQLLITATNGWNQIIAEPFNMWGIPRLMEMNGWPTDVTPKLMHGAPDVASVTEALEAVKALAAMGSEIPMLPSVQRKILAKVGLDPDEDELKTAFEEQEERDEEADDLPPQPPFPANLLPASEGEEE